MRKFIPDDGGALPVPYGDAPGQPLCLLYKDQHYEYLEFSAAALECVVRVAGVRFDAAQLLQEQQHALSMRGIRTYACFIRILHITAYQKVLAVGAS